MSTAHIKINVMEVGPVNTNRVKHLTCNSLYDWLFLDKVRAHIYTTTLPQNFIPFPDKSYFSFKPIKRS